MKILYNSIIDEIKNLVEIKAKYQKVMLLFDDYVSNLEIKKIYDEIKEICIYNQCNINSVEDEEINNGYKIIIFLCEIDSFLKRNIIRDEVINVFCPKDENLLPYYLNDRFGLKSSNSFLLLDKKSVDVGLISSVCFNLFFNYFCNLMNNKNSPIDLSFAMQENFKHDIINQLEQLDKNMKFYDIELLYKCNIPYRQLVLVDLILIDAILILISSFKHHSFMLVDIYKSVKDNEILIDKFYAIANNETFKNLVILNSNCLTNFCLKTKQKILDCVNVFSYSHDEIKNVLAQIKEYSKQDGGLLAYLYTFNIFGL